jgi:hypothetical protein
VGELGIAADPKELVPGEPGLILAMADSYARLGVAFEDIGHGFTSIDDGGWRGAAADAFHARLQHQPTRFLLAADAFVSAGAALDCYAHALHWAQGQAAEAIALAADGGRAEPTAEPERLTPAEEVERTGVLSGVPAGPAPAPPDHRAAAADTLARARGQLEQIGHEAAQLLRAATTLAPVRVALPTTTPAPTPATARPAPPSVPQRIVVRLPAPVDTAAQHPDARIKALLDHDGLRDDPAGWEAGIAALRKRLQRRRLDQLSPRLLQHLFDGHRKPRPRGPGYRDLGYHHREHGVDRGPMRVREIVAGPDVNGVYRAVVAGPRTEGGPETKLSSFFPDSWTRDDVARAIRHAFTNRTFFDGRSDRIRRKWRGTYRGVKIEGYVECQVIEPTIDARSAHLYHIVTAYPILRGGGSHGEAD